MTHEAHPWRLKAMLPGAIRDRLRLRPTLIIPVGATESHGAHLPLGGHTIIVERLADDLSARHGVIRTPAIEFGVGGRSRPHSGGAALRRRTLHRLMNELIESWEAEAGVREFVVLTAQADDAHLEALSTIRTDGATVQVMDILGMDFGHLLQDVGPRHRVRALERALLLHLAPALVGPETERPPIGPEGSPSPRAPVSAPKGAELYRFILDRISTSLDRV